MVAGALLSHVLGYFYTWGTLAEQPQLYLRLFTRGATPGLLILFGFMLEFVYVKYAQRRGFGFSVKRMFYRALLCYLAAASIAAAGMLGGHTTVKELVGNLLGISTALNANIFRLYSCILLAVMPVIALRLRFGVGSLLVVIAGIWLVDVTVLQFLGNPFSGALENLSFTGKFLFGLDDSWGPSIFHGLTAVLFGMILGNFFSTRSGASIIYLGGLTGAALVILGTEVLTAGWNEFLAGVANYEAYRGHNSIIYYAYGAVHAVVLMFLARVINSLLSEAVRKPVTYLGSRTFLFFLFGNLILSAIPRGYVNTNFWVGIGGFVLLTAICYGLILLWEAKLDGWQPVVAVRKGMLGFSGGLTKMLRRFGAAHQTSLKS